MTPRLSAPSLHLLEIRVAMEAQARPWLRLVSKSAGKQRGQWVVDMEFVE